SCNQCSACKAGLRIASSAIDELFDRKRATPDDPERALFGALSAPQANRCYLPVQGSILIPSLLTRFAADFQEQRAHPDAAAPDWPTPKLVAYGEAAHRVTYDERQARKQPDWTYGEPPARPAPKQAVSVRLAPDLAAKLHERAEAAGVDLDRQVE